MHYDFFEKELAVIISTEYNESLNNLPTDSLLLASSSSHHHKFNKNNSLSDDLEQDVTRGDFWHTLWHHQIDLNTRKNSSALAFDFSLLNKEIENSITKQLDGTSSSCSTPDPKSPRKTQIGRTALCSFCVYNSPITSPGDATCPSILNIPSVVSLPFEPVVEDFVKIEKQIKVGWKVLNDHLMMSCPLVAKSVIDKLCTDYIIAQVQQSHILCHAIFNRVEKYRNKKDPKFTNLCSIPHVDLLQCLLELYFMSCQKLSFPLPSGFQVTFCETTFHSLHFDLFIQHVQCGILVLQIDSVKRIIKTLDDTAESMKKKLICIGYLPKEEGEALLKKWKSSIGVRYKEFRTARESLAQNPRSPGVQSINEQDIEFLSQNSTEADVTNDAQEVETPD